MIIPTIARGPRAIPEAGYDYRYGWSPAWGRRALAAAEAVHGAPPREKPDRTPPNAAQIALRAERQAWYDRMRDAGVSRKDAAATIGIGRNRSCDYEDRRAATRAGCAR